MKFSTTALLAILSSLVSVQAACSVEAGNYYCSPTTKVIYEGLGYSGTYQDVISMDESTGTCGQQPYSFSGNLSPLDEELSVHIRGPLKLLQFGVYYPSPQNQKREEEPECNTKHVHHRHKRAVEIVAVTETVIVDGQGNTISAPATQTSTVADELSTTLPDNNQLSSLEGFQQPSISTQSAPTTTSQASAEPSAVAGGAWTRSSYYTPGSADNCVFLNYFGGSGSGVWSAGFGNSLSYANSDNSGGASSPVALGDVTVGSNSEYVIMSGSPCGNDDGCGFYRPGTVAQHGFGGDSKIFIFEFQMPSDPSASGLNADMPAVWLLNAKIPRTLQYGDASCSCWKTGCGELDLFEILSTGSNKLISHLHDGQGADGTNTGGGGSQDYFVRPTSGSMKAAVIFSGTEVHIVQVDDSVTFGGSLSQDTVNGWLQQQGSIATLGY
ncbi:TOS1 [[Candida] subhashii]|uniref:glucan endo-1,3-beta-D-glucosidase n=1 Tax=[Candida] subhashii TaxID=561895 RepID=A0A8J5Q8X3_9ASCO|nr:TOS1 [[Candida] subhashii]KAG7661551.1 TOS1 [[Candida] subhashii]